VGGVGVMAVGWIDKQCLPPLSTPVLTVEKRRPLAVASWSPTCENKSAARADGEALCPLSALLKSRVSTRSTAGSTPGNCCLHSATSAQSPSDLTTTQLDSLDSPHYFTPLNRSNAHIRYAADLQQPNCFAAFSGGGETHSTKRG